MEGTDISKGVFLVTEDTGFFKGIFLIIMRL